MSRPASPTRHIRVPSTTHTAITTTPTPVMASPSHVPEPDPTTDSLLRLRYCHFQQKQNIPSHDLCPQCNIMIPPHKLFPSNYIRTTKYTFWTFLPKNLMEQFMKIANFYFLIVAILSLTPLSPKTPIVSIAPLIFVLSVTGIKEAYEDYQRYRIDVETNSSLVQCWRNGTWQRIRWMDVVFGDLVRIESEHYFPADLVLLQSSSPQGTCSIETANLDGETNLKIKQAVPATYEIVTDQDDGRDYPHKFVGILESDAPNDKMDAAAWKGNFISIPGAAPKVPLSMTQLLLRGCRLRNTAWIIGIVCFTGFDTKLMLQNKGKEIKRSLVDKTVDRALYVIFTIQATVCTFGAIAQSVWLNSHDHLWYLPFTFDINSESAQSFLTYLVLVDILVPISLYVSMELVKFAQAFYINVDIHMYYAPANIPAKARTSNLNEELGQIDYIFSDKTGTLTRNEMKFYRCTVGKEPYGPGCMAESKQQVERAPPCKGIPPFKSDYMFEDNRLYHRLCNGLPADRHLINEFLTMLSVCHTVMPSFPGCISNHIHARDGCDIECEYHAQSPDELALVEAALSQQYYFHHLTPMKFQYRGFEIEGNRMTVNIQGEHHHFDLFEVLEFNSTRKRMSVIVLDHRDNQLKLYCKGADNVIRERMTSTSVADMWDATNRHLQSFAKVGLRTLCCAYRVLDGPTFDTWWRSHLIAKSSMENRSEMVASSYDEIEVDLTLLGTTAIEDRLQEGVPETIYKLKKAGIKIWVLTGDKVETAINIGRSCRLLTDLMRGDHLIVMDIDESLDDIEARIQTMECLDAAEIALQQHKTNQTLEHVGVVVSGKALGFIFPRRLLDKKKREIIPPPHILQQEHQLQLRFLALCSDVSAVICCRMSPKQKSQVVRLVKENYKDKITLAIGDGANDVAMIEAAHVGVGIEGLEGKQAVMASDYSIGQFAYLQRLLLVHGAWSYRRLSTLILYSFYKNVTCSMTQIWFAIFSGYSAQLFFDAYSGALFNLLFTSLPVLACAIFNRDISAETMLAFPKLYACGRHREVFNMRTLFAWIFKGMCDSVMVFFFTINIMSATGNDDGHDNDHWVMSTAMFTTIVVMVNIKIGFETTTWVKWSFLCMFLSLISWWVWMFFYCSIQLFNEDMYGVIYRLVRQASFWLLIAICTAIAMIPDVLWRFVRTQYFPRTVDLGMYHFPFLVADQQADEAFEADTARQVQAQLLQMATMEAEQQRIAAEQTAYQQQSHSQPTHMQMPFVRNKLVGTNSLSSMRSGDDILIHDTDGTRKLSSWQQLAQQRNEQNLGYTPWIESEGESSHVMGQARFVQVNVNARTTPQWQTRHIKDPYESKN